MAELPEPRDGEPGGRRGRRPVRPDPESGPVALLAYRLWELKERAGDPSFAEMASRMGAAASKSSLAAAARGLVLPSWETTWEFVRVLAVDRLGQEAEETEREWRGHWERARNGDRGVLPTAATTGAAAGTSAGISAGTDERAPGTRERDGGDRETRPSRAGRSVRKPVVLAALSALVAGGTIALVILVSSSAGKEGTEMPAPPLVPPPGTSAPAASPLDDSAFEGDITHPDGTVVRRGTRFTKVWRIRNTGTIPWRGRYLDRTNDTPCEAPERVAIQATAPGEAVDIAVDVRAADRPGRCKIYWKMTNEDGAPLFAGKNPIFLDVTVQ